MQVLIRNLLNDRGWQVPRLQLHCADTAAGENMQYEDHSVDQTAVHQFTPNKSELNSTSGMVVELEQAQLDD
jgi:hypothetical protein